jgi:hypothetical protein
MKGELIMIRGTTAQFKFILPYPKSECSSIRIQFWQPNNPSEWLPITRTEQDCSTTEDDKELCVSLTAEETARFSDKYKAKVQLRARTTDSAFGSRPQLITVYPMPDDVIEGDPTMPPADKDGWIILDGESVVD